MPIPLVRRFNLAELRWDHSAALALAVFGNAMVLLMLALPRGDFDPYLPVSSKPDVVFPDPIVDRPRSQEAVPDMPKPPERPVKIEPTPAIVPMPTVEHATNALPLTDPVFEGRAAPIDAPFGPSTALQVGPSGPAGYLINPDPPYPSLAKRRGWEGTVFLRVLVGADGRPREVRVLRTSGHSILDTSAQDQVLSKWRFQPATRDGLAIEGWVEIPVEFRIGRY